jgi:hypothetical protein
VEAEAAAEAASAAALPKTATVPVFFARAEVGGGDGKRRSGEGSHFAGWMFAGNRRDKQTPPDRKRQSVNSRPNDIAGPFKAL